MILSGLVAIVLFNLTYGPLLWTDQNQIEGMDVKSVDVEKKMFV